MGKPYFKPPDPIVTRTEARAAAEQLIADANLVVRAIEHKSALDLSQIHRSDFEAGTYFVRFGRADKKTFTDVDTVCAVTVDDQTGIAERFLTL